MFAARSICLTLALVAGAALWAQPSPEALLRSMTLDEKVGQLVMRMPPADGRDTAFRRAVREGRVGAVLNVVDPVALRELQEVAVSGSRLGVPLVFARDVIHGYRTILPIPLGQAAAWDADLVEAGARMSAREAASVGIRWTFAPMLDVSRDPRWGRIAESFGEDPLLTAVLGAAAVRGYQDHGDSLLLAATAKHFVAYGASEGGRDYNSANVPMDELVNVYLPPFRAALDAGARSVMPSFSDLNGIPPTAHRGLFRDLLRNGWGFDGVAVSDWASIDQLMKHGVAGNIGDAARLALEAGMDLDMMSRAYPDTLADLVGAGVLDEALVDEAVLRVLRLKRDLGLWDHPHARTDAVLLAPEHRALARETAARACVLLRNDGGLLPLGDPGRVALIGPLANDGYEQLGTWVFDGRAEDSRTVLEALRAEFGPDRVSFTPALARSRDRDTSAFGEARRAAAAADVAVLVLGEEAILSGEAHSRADLRLPGAQVALLRAVAGTGTPVVAVVFAGRPLVLTEALPHAEAWLYAWAPGTEGGPAVVDLLLGRRSPSGRLPVTFPRHEGQIPVYHARRNTGNPPDSSTWVPIDVIPDRAFQTSLGNTSHYLDIGFAPLFPFGFGLTYTRFAYGAPRAERDTLSGEDSVAFTVRVRNAGTRPGTETVQVYLSDPVSSVARPVRQLVAWRRVALEPGASRSVRFALSREALGYHYPDGFRMEPGAYRFHVGGDARASRSFTVHLLP
jgi:beta-glucosidase